MQVSESFKSLLEEQERMEDYKNRKQKFAYKLNPFKLDERGSSVSGHTLLIQYI